MDNLEFQLRLLEIIEEMQEYCNCSISTNVKLQKLRDELKAGGHLESSIVMVKVNGANFRCDCGGNVFSRSKATPEKLQCNSCRAWYKGVPAQQGNPAELPSSDECLCSVGNEPYHEPWCPAAKSAIR